MTGVLHLGLPGASTPAVVEYGFAIEKKGASDAWVRQVHGRDFRVVDRSDTATSKQSAPPADAVITSTPGLEIHVYTADCLPVLLAGSDDMGNTTIAAIHSGWRGTMQGIVPAVLAEWKIPLEQTYAVVGPAISGCHFEVKEDFVQEFSAHAPKMQNYLDRENSKMFFRLAEFVRGEQLREIPADHYRNEFQICTYCSLPELPSYRRNKGTDPQIRAWIRIRA